MLNSFSDISYKALKGLRNYKHKGIKVDFFLRLSLECALLGKNALSEAHVMIEKTCFDKKRVGNNQYFACIRDDIHDTL